MGVRHYLASGIVFGSLAALAGCTGGSFFAEREPWRHDAEVACLNSGSVKEGAGRVLIKPISGPGICGADFPIKVSALGESGTLGYSDELRPPANIPNGALPRWPGDGRPDDSSGDRMRDDGGGPVVPPPAGVQSRPLGAPPAGSIDDPRRSTDRPVVLGPPGASSPGGAAAEPYDFRGPYGTSAPAVQRRDVPAYDLSPEPYDQRRVMDDARRLSHPKQPPAGSGRPRGQSSLPALGPARPAPVTAVSAVTVSPAATLACPIVSVLDHWIGDSVQPAAMRWFGQPVIEIRQISAYSCRGMNGNPHAHISEHAFGNALDIAAFTLADGRRITVKTGWHGTPEEQGFLRDVQATACEQFTTVLAPGSNAYHYDHIHLDLMRRAGARRACNPHAVSGQEAAARARYAGRRGDASVTGSLPSRKSRRLSGNAYAEPRELPRAVPGDDGED